MTTQALSSTTTHHDAEDGRTGSRAMRVAAGAALVAGPVLWAAGMWTSPPAAGTSDAEWLQRARGWSPADWTVAADALTARGLLAGGALTADGVAVRAAVEDDTDRLARGPWAALGAAGCDRLAELLVPVRHAVVAIGDWPARAAPAPRGSGRERPRGHPLRSLAGARDRMSSCADLGADPSTRTRSRPRR